LKAASPGTLNSYLAGMRTLLRLFPSRWGQIMAADLVVRSERWARIREEFERSAPPLFDSAAPWDAVIGASAYGRDGPNSNWWQTSFILPTTLNVTVPSTVGIPFAGAGTKRRADNSAAARMTEHLAGDGSWSHLDACKNWNLRSGRCKGNEPCPHSRLHMCHLCGGNHRAIDYHGSQAAFGSEAPKGKGKGGKKGKGKKGKSDKGKKGQDTQAAAST